MRNIKRKKKRDSERLNQPFPDLYIKEYWDMTKEQPDQGVMLWRTRIKDDL